MISRDRLGYEAMMGLGDPSGLDFSSIFGNTGLYDAGGNYIPPFDPGPYIPPSTYTPAYLPSKGFDWSSIIAPITNTGLKIAANVTNPAYNTPGAYTRLPDGTVIATAGKESTGYTSVAPGGMNLSPIGVGGISPFLLLGGVAVVALMMLKK